MINKKNLNFKSILKEVVTTLILIFIIANVLSYFRAPNLNSQTLPQISTTLIDGTEFSTNNYHDKPILIHIWATWCPTCKLEASNIEKISKHFNVITFAVKSGNNAEINNYLKQHDLHFKTINDNMSYHANTFKVSAYPTTFIYDKNHQLIFSEVGYTSTLMLYLKMLWVSI
jgi:thiol-disulfide isomerase/thioredoxin